jgi:hypothetical protein
MYRTALDHRVLIMLLYLAAFTSIDIVPGEGSALNSSAQETLTHNIYLYTVDKAFITGYVRDVGELGFLKGSQYKYQQYQT